MTRKVRILISFILVAVAFATGIAVYSQSERMRNAQADGTATTRYTVVDGKIAPPPSDQTKAKGTEENPFFILEIVPYEGLGTFGYHIGGCEPIDMEGAGYNGFAIPMEDSHYDVKTYTARKWFDEEGTKYFPKTQTDNQDQYGTMKYVEDGSGNYNRKSDPAPVYEYEPVPEGYEGTKYTEESEGVYVPDKDGTLIRRTKSAEYEYVGTGGNYLWTPLPADTCVSMSNPEKSVYLNAYHDPDENGEFKTVFKNVPCYISYSAKKYTHMNAFLRESVGLAYEMKDGKRIPYQEEEGKPTLAERIANYKCVVYTVTPEDLNIQKDGVLVNKELIEKADLVSISSVDSTSVAINAYNTYKKYDSSGLLCKKNTNMSGISFKNNPLDWPAALALYQRASSTTDPLPIIWDTHTYTYFTTTFKNVQLKCKTPNGNVDRAVDGSQDNMFKLYLMLYMMNTPVFQSFFGNPADYKTVDMGGGLTTPLLKDYEGESQRYWSSWTLYPWKSGLLPDVKGLDNAANVAVLDTLGIMNGGGSPLFQYNTSQNLVRNGIHIYDGSTSLTTNFEKPSGVKNNQYGREVYEFFESIGEKKTSVTTAEVLYYLLNGLHDSPNKVTKENYRVLELQPDTKFKSDTKAGTVEDDAFWKAFIGMYANTMGKVTVDRMSTSEFIGKKQELISDYDLIYIGVDASSENWSMDFGEKDFVYAHTGPLVTVTTEKLKPQTYGWLDTDLNKFVLSGNDITEAKRTDLKEYADSGALLLFGTGFFTDEKANTAAASIDRNSNIYKVSDEDVAKPIYEYALTKQSTRMTTELAIRKALKKERRLILKDVTEPLAYKEGAANLYLPSNTLSFKFTVSAPAGSIYELALYVDINGDGVFSKSERLEGLNIQKSSGGTVKNGKVQAGETYVVKRVVADRKGAVHWKLDFIDTDESKELKERTVYASLSGLSAIKATKKERLRILQIEMPNNNTVKLPMAGENPSKGSIPWKFKEWTKDVNGLDISFVRMKEDAILKELEKNPKYLQSEYEMVIMGFGDMYNGVKSDVVIDAIQGFMEAGKAVLYTHDSSSMVGYGGGLGAGVDAASSKELTLAFRDAFGMDRYDVSIHKGKEGVERQDYPYEPSSSKSGNLSKIGSEVLAHGISNGHLYKLAPLNSSNVYSKKISQVNMGAITEYPFHINPTISVAETHPQYYQLDMEEELMNVWYCLDNSQGDNNIGKYYKYTYNDVRNNYYIYNCGNITYSGMGHSGGMSDEEIKLFINTFVAAYRAAASPAQVVILNDDVTKKVTEGKNYLSVDLDSADGTQLLGGEAQGVHTDYDVVVKETVEEDGEEKENVIVETEEGVSKRVYFRIEDTSSSGEVTGFDLVISADFDGAMDIRPFAIYRTADVGQDAGAVYVDGTKVKLNSEDIYYVDIPVKYEMKSATEKAVTTTAVEFDVTMYYVVGKSSFSVSGLTKVDITPRGFFNLD